MIFSEYIISMSIYKLSTANYEELNNNIQDLLKTGVYSSVNITIFLDANGTQVANTEIGRLENKPIKNVSQTDAYEDKNNGSKQPAKLTIAFKDGGSLDYVDSMIDCWYTISGNQNTVRKKFG